MGQRARTLEGRRHPATSASMPTWREGAIGIERVKDAIRPIVAVYNGFTEGSCGCTTRVHVALKLFGSPL